MQTSAPDDRRTGRTVMRKIDIIPSKSDAHRALICAALSTKPCQVICQAESKDIAATRKCLEAVKDGRDCLLYTSRCV